MKTHALLPACGSLLIGTLGLVAAASGATNFVTVSGLRFQPSALTIAVGDTVVFSGGGDSHTVTGDGAEPFCGTPRFTTCSVTFSNAGTFPYHCIPHQSQNMTGVVHVVSGATSPLTLVLDGRGTVTPNLHGQSLLLGGSYTVTAQPAAGFAFTGWTGGLTAGTARITFIMQPNLVLEAHFTDMLRPVLAITAPRPNIRLTNSTVTFTGTAMDNDAFTVEYRLQSSTGLTGFLPATGTTNWSAVLDDLAPGAYRFQARARDDTGNLSVEATRHFQVLARLQVSAVDPNQGTVAGGFLGTTYRDVGRRLSLRAIPRPGYLFADWTGDIVSPANPLIFVIRSNVTLQANFAANPFLPLKGSYSGLFHVTTPANQVRHESSGFFTFSLTDRGRYTGSLQVGGKRRPFSGGFGLDGKATNSVAQPGTNALSLELMLDLANGTDRVMGRVIDAGMGWTAGLLGDRAPEYRATNASPYRGRYTLLLEPEADSDMGASYGTVVINANGRLTFLGNLADGTPVSQGATVSKAGDWPLYAALYGGRGSLLSWGQVDTDPAPAESLSGDVSWIKPTLPGARFHPAGFTNTLDLEGSIYLPPGTNKVLQIDLGTVRCEGGNLTQAFTNAITLGANNKITNLTTNQPLVLNIVRPTGLFNGSVTVMDGAARRKLLFKGAVLQHQNFGAGYFPGTNQSGLVALEPVP